MPRCRVSDSGIGAIRPLFRLLGAGLVGLCVLVGSARPTPAPEASPGAPPEVKKGYDVAANELLCYCGCSRLTIKECTCGVAFQLREQFEAKLAAGQSADTIIAAYIDEHGEQSRNVPPRKGLNLVAWFGPASAILAAGGVMILVYVYKTSRRRAAAASAAPIATAPPSAADEATRRQLEKDLLEVDL